MSLLNTETASTRVANAMQSGKSGESAGRTLLSTSFLAGSDLLLCLSDCILRDKVESQFSSSPVSATNNPLLIRTDAFPREWRARCPWLKACGIHWVELLRKKYGKVQILVKNISQQASIMIRYYKCNVRPFKLIPTISKMGTCYFKHGADAVTVLLRQPQCKMGEQVQRAGTNLASRISPAKMAAHHWNQECVANSG